MKYAFLLLALIFAGCTDGGYETSTDETFSTESKSSNDGGYETFTYVGETMQVAKEDFPNEMNWYNAMSACQNLGNGWRLPSIDELKAMYEQLHTKGKGNFRTNVWYWSSSEDDASIAWYFYFGDGKANYKYYYKYNTKQVRAVRTLP